VGFSSLGSFSHWFRGRCGESPARFKARFGDSDEQARLASVAPHCLALMASAFDGDPNFSRSRRRAGPLQSQ
jgi:hypothetical protein